MDRAFSALCAGNFDPAEARTDRVFSAAGMSKSADFLQAVRPDITREQSTCAPVLACSRPAPESVALNGLRSISIFSNKKKASNYTLRPIRSKGSAKYEDWKALPDTS